MSKDTAAAADAGKGGADTAAGKAAETTVKLSDDIRGALGADDGGTEKTGGAEGAEGAAEAAGGGEGAEAAEAGKEVAQEALAEALPDLSPAQIKALAENPAVVEAVLSGQTGQATLDTLFKEIMEENATTAQAKEAQAAETKTIEEALKLGQEEGDWSAFGAIMGPRLLAQAETSKAEKGIREKVTREVLSSLDTAVENVYGDVLDTLTKEELKGLARGNFRDDAGFMTAVLKALDDKRTSMLQSEAGGGSSAAEAAKIAAAASSARQKVGVGALPGGSGVESAGESIGDLLRRGLRGAFDDESD